MCGLIAFTGKSDPSLIQHLTDQARRRGPDSMGFAWRSGGEWLISRRRTPSWPEPFTACFSSTFEAGIGHARLATSGRGVQDAQPLFIEYMVFAHNGTVYRHEELADRWVQRLKTGNDSEVLGHLFRLFGYDAEGAMEELREHQGDTPHAFVAAAGNHMWIASFGQPLYLRETPEARYACSWRFPDSREMASGTVTRWEIVGSNADPGVPEIPPNPSRLKL